MNRLLLQLLLLAPLALRAQVAAEPFTQGELDRIFNRAFSKLVTGNASPGEIASYAGLDPVNAVFTAKGTMPVYVHDKNWKNMSKEQKLEAKDPSISYLSFSFKGGLVDNNAGSLFTGGSLNSGAEIGLQYHFRLGKKTLGYFNDDAVAARLRKQALRSNHYLQKELVYDSYSPQNLALSRYQYELQRNAALSRMARKQASLDQTLHTIGSTGIAAHPELADTLIFYRAEVAKARLDAAQAAMAVDSINILAQSDPRGQAKLRAIGMIEKLKADYDSLLAHVPVQKLSVGWMSVTFGYNRVAYNTYNAGAPFESQFDKKKDDGFSYGLAFSHIWQNRINEKTWFVNAAITRQQSNNLKLLSATTVDESRKQVNASGDTTRVVSRKVNAYTDPVITRKVSNLTVHGYYIYGKRASGLHISPSIDFGDDSQNVANLTFAYLFSIANEAKDKPLFNAEFYVRINDLGDNAKARNLVLKRTDIGVSFTIPFTIF